MAAAAAMDRLGPFVLCLNGHGLVAWWHYGMCLLVMIYVGHGHVDWRRDGWGKEVIEVWLRGLMGARLR